MTATIKDLIENLELLPSTDAVRRKNNSYAQNEEGAIIALSLSNSKFTTINIPKEASALEHLYLNANKELENIHFKTALPHLEHLYIEECALKELRIPEAFGSLRQVYARNNKLKQIIFEGDCPALELLDLSDNELQDFTLPTIFDQLEYLYLKGEKNVIKNIPKEIWQKNTNSWPEVSSFLRASLQSGDILNQEAKCIFFGNGRTGKTTISHQLREGEFDATIEYTHGILIKEWIIEQSEYTDEMKHKFDQEIVQYLNRRGKSLEMPINLQINVWDFGGQEYFHATHRLFLNSNVLYLIVWEEQTNEQDEIKGNYPYTYWQKNILHYAPQNTIIFIQNKERGSAIINHSELQYKVSDCHWSKNQYGLDIEILKKAILQQLPSLEYLGTPIPKLYDQIRQELRKRKAIAPYLSFQDYKHLCQEQDTTADKIMQNDADIQSLTTFLHDTGSLICYRFNEDKKSKILEDYVFIDPEWVTNTVYQILDEKTLEEHGEFDKKHVGHVLEIHQNKILDANLWIDLMKEFELIFEKNGTENQFIAPQYLPATCQDLSDKAQQNLHKELPFKLVLSYPDFLPKSVMSRFICRYGNLASDYYWKYGIVVHQAKEKMFVWCDYEKREITIQSRRSFSEFMITIFNTLRDIDDTEDLAIAVSNNQNTEQLIGPVNFKKLRRQLEKGRDYVDWQGEEFELVHFKGVVLVYSNKNNGIAELGERKRGVIPRIKKNFPDQFLDVKRESNTTMFIPFKEITESIKILFLASTPMTSRQLNTGKESRFKDLFRYFGKESRFNFKEEHGITEEQFRNFLLYENPHIVHYGGHGEKKGIILEDQVLEADILAEIIQLSEKVQCVILNACNSLPIAEKLAQYIPYVIGTKSTINDRSAIEFARGFYMGIVANKTIEQSFKHGIIAIKSKKLPDANVLVLVKGIQSV